MAKSKDAKLRWDASRACETRSVPIELDDLLNCSKLGLGLIAGGLASAFLQHHFLHGAQVPSELSPASIATDQQMLGGVARGTPL